MERDRVFIIADVLIVAGASSVFSRKATRDKIQYAQEEAASLRNQSLFEGPQGAPVLDSSNSGFLRGHRGCSLFKERG